MKSRIYYAKPSITELEVSYATDAARNGWGEKCYEYITRFEDSFESHLGVKYAIATSSCTGALHLGFAALGIGPSDEVIMADTNWVASAAPLVHLGATPVLIDILEDTWCLDPELIEAAITDKTRAILAVHLYGNLCEMDRLLEIGEKHGIPVIEDAAEALGSQFHGKRAGSMGAFGAFSFHGTKTLTTGEGGMFVTNDADLYEKVLTLSNHGRSRQQTRQFWADEVGYKYKMSNIQAAIGCAQLERIEELVARKREIFWYYENGFRFVDGVSLNPEPTGTINGYWMPTAVFDPDSGVTRSRIIADFQSQNIDARVFFWPLSSFDEFSSKTETINSHDIVERAVNLPSYHDIKTDELDRVIEVITTAISRTT
jgi:perosamine synthetase